MEPVSFALPLALVLTVATSQQIAPAGTLTTFPSQPLDVAVSRAGKVAVKSSHGIVFVDGGDGHIVQTLPLAGAHSDYPSNLGGNGLAGIAWNAEGTRVWSGDGFDGLRSATAGADGRFHWDPDVVIPDPDKIAQPAGLAIAGGKVFVAASRQNAVYVIDERHRTIVKKIAVGVSPFAVMAAGSRIYVTNLGGAEPRKGEPRAVSGGIFVRVDARGIAEAGSVSVIDANTLRVAGTVAVGRHPGAMAVAKSGRVLVLNSNDDTLSAIDPTRLKVERTVPLPLQSQFGASASALAVSPRDGRIYLAEGGDNRVLVLDSASYAAAGQIPTGWYPDGVAFGSSDRLYVTSLKGWGSRGQDFKFPRNDLDFRLDHPLVRDGFNVYDYSGLLQVLHAGGDVVAASPSRAAFAPAAFEPDAAYSTASVVPVPVRPGQRSAFQHVVYVIKENHTYDDFFGDLPEGNGDPRFCAFPERVSPNHHALARQFGLFDNFYVNGTMSGDGHQWTDEGATTDYVERNTASWARTYPSDGTDPLAYTSSGFIWQRFLDAGLTFRDYGEFTVSEPDTTPENATWTQFYDDRRLRRHTVTFKNRIQLKSLAPYVDPNYPGFSLRIPDQVRADEFLRELADFSAHGTFPALSVVQLGNDHTAGTYPGYPVPDAAVADNDYALGRIVEGIARSPYWKDTAIFVVEDDAQNGVDHVDGRRTTALVISAYNRPHTVDSHFYDQTSILRTIEAIFGLAPLTQFDANAPLIVAPFGLQPVQDSYVALENRVKLDVLNPKRPAKKAS